MKNSFNNTKSWLKNEAATECTLNELTELRLWIVTAQKIAQHQMDNVTENRRSKAELERTLREGTSELLGATISKRGAGVIPITKMPSNFLFKIKQW